MFTKSQDSLVIISAILFATISLFARPGCSDVVPAQGGAVVGPPSVTPTAESPAQNPFASIPTPGPEDEADGDNGALIKNDSKLLKDFEKESQTNNSRTLMDNHQFYKPEYIKDPQRAMGYWVDFSKIPLSQTNLSTKHEMLSNSHRRAAPIKLSFEFPFYGQPLRNIIIATGGFLYVGEHLHHWLAATQNISPLMANFDLSAKNTSDIHYYDNGTSLVVQWLNVTMKDNKPPGNFSFQVTLHKNGDIVFVYKSIPVPVGEIPDDEHPVKVGISDAFLIDKVAFFIRRKTIYDYHRLNMKDVEIGNQTAIYLKALPTCNQYDTCEQCSKASTLECIWCPTVKRCSNGFDRKRQEWISNGCDKLTKSDCSVKADAGVQQGQSSSSSSSSNQLISVDSPQQGKQSLPPNSRSSEGGTAFVTFLMFMALTSGVALWAFYAYKNPHTPSGQMLIKYRPGNWRWQNAETRYTAASIHM